MLIRALPSGSPWEKNMSEQSRASRELAILKGAVENTVEAFVTIDRSHRVIFFNRAAENMFGVGREEAMGKDLNIILTPDCSEDHRRAVQACVADQ